MDTEAKTTVGGVPYNKRGQPLIPCELCGKPTTATGTKRCDRCWELESRIRWDVQLAERILHQIKENQ